MRVRRDYAGIRKTKWRDLAADELGAVMARLASWELHSTRLAVRGRLRRRRLEAVALFRQIHGPLSEKWMWVPRNVRTPKFPTESITFRGKPMWHVNRSCHPTARVRRLSLAAAG